MSASITGKMITRLRKQKRMNHKEFTQWLHEETGLSISNRELAQMENYGRRDACNPVQPPNEISSMVEQYLESDDMGKNVRKKLSKILAQYEKLGFLQGDKRIKPSEMVEAYELEMKELLESLEGDSIDSTTEAKNEIEQLRKEREKVNKQLEVVQHLIDRMDKGEKLDKKVIDDLIDISLIDTEAK